MVYGWYGKVIVVDCNIKKLGGPLSLFLVDSSCFFSDKNYKIKYHHHHHHYCRFLTWRLCDTETCVQFSYRWSGVMNLWSDEIFLTCEME